MDLYSVNGQVYDLSTALFKSNTLSLSQGELHCVLFKIADALQNVHFSGYLHNDVKMDNIILYRSQNMCQVEPILINFNRACKIRGSVKKKLTVDEKECYRKRHRHIAPEIVQGVSSQNVYTDIYSYGYIIHLILKHEIFESEELKRIEKDTFKADYMNGISLTNVKQIFCPTFSELCSDR